MAGFPSYVNNDDLGQEVPPDDQPDSLEISRPRQVAQEDQPDPLEISQPRQAAQDPPLRRRHSDLPVSINPPQVNLSWAREDSGDWSGMNSFPDFGNYQVKREKDMLPQ